MKKVFYLLAVFVGLGLTGCEPMEDIHDEINYELDNSLAVGTTTYTLTEDNYESLDIAEEGFTSVEEAGELIPFLLNELYPVYGEESAIGVTFNLFEPITPEVYTVTSDGYAAVDLDDNYFSGISQIQAFLEYQFPRAEAGDHIELTYNAVANEIAYTLTAEDFDFIQDELGSEYPDETGSAAQYSNFDRREGNGAYWSNEMILEAIDVVLLENIDEGVEGQTYNVSYAIYDGSSGTESMTVRFNGESYVLSGGMAYDVSNGDFDLIGEEFAETYPEAAESAATYNNFDRREDNDAYWNENMILEGLNFLLKENFPNAGAGAQYNVSYRTYTEDGSSSEMISLVMNEEGEYVIDEEGGVSTVETTNVFALTNGTWNMPLTLTSEDYATMGQSYPNFDDEAEAYQMISVFLGMEYPYAREGDMRSVAYDFYEGSTSTRYTLFVFEDGEWTAIPRTIQQTLQFSHNGDNWEPDNTIRYNLTGPDYDYIAEALSDVEGYQAATSNLAQYGNFNLNNWENDMILEGLRVLLDNIDPSAEVGQKYILTYEVYPGYVLTRMNLIKNAEGEWVVNE